MAGKSSSALLVPLTVSVQPDVALSPLLVQWMQRLPDECEARHLVAMANCGLQVVLGVPVPPTILVATLFHQNSPATASVRSPLPSIRIRTHLNALSESALIELLDNVPQPMRANVLLSLIEQGLSHLLGQPFTGLDLRHFIQQRLPGSSVSEPVLAERNTLESAQPQTIHPAPAEPVVPSLVTEVQGEVAVFDMGMLEGLIPSDFTEICGDVT